MSSQAPHHRSWRATTGALASGALLLTALAASPVGAKGPQLVAATGDPGTYLTDDAGMTLYYFAKDGPGTSVCNDKCATAWPPVLLQDGETTTVAAGVTGVTAAIKRDDGSTQATYDGRPLYHFAKDKVAGDVLGQDVGEVWFVAATDGSLPPAPIYTIDVVTGGPSGTYLTGEDGKTLYVFAKDTVPGVSTCTGDCLVDWPPFENGGRDVFVAGDGVTGVIVEVPSGQVTYDGRPLYYFKDDAAAGDVKGQGEDDFFVATVDGSMSTAP
jgi:predicted lipoprotein with Yx(FWY)xxD motif